MIEGQLKEFIYQHTIAVISNPSQLLLNSATRLERYKKYYFAKLPKAQKRQFNQASSTTK